MHSAFPEDERRDDGAQRRNVDSNEKMQCLLIKDGDVNVGFITVWKLPCGVTYIEHFAIADDLRHSGYGTLSLSELTVAGYDKLILEVEMPSTAESVRRIAFYEKNGLTLWSKPYIQPPYSSDKQSLSMRIMTLGSGSDQIIESAVAEIYKYVYDVE